MFDGDHVMFVGDGGAMLKFLKSIMCGAVMFDEDHV